MRVSIIVPTINGLPLLRECLPALERQTYRNFETILVDDGGSTDGTLDYVRECHPAVRIVALTRNRGYAGACNAGLAAARGEIVGILGNDNRPEPAWLGELVRALDEHPRAAAVMSRTVEATDAGPCSYGSLGPLGTNERLTWHWPVERPPIATFYPSGNGLLVRRALITRFYDDDYSMYHEDVSLGWRLRLAGWDVLFVTSAVTHHGGGKTTSRQPGRRIFYQTRNRLLNLLLHYERATLARLAPVLVLDALARLALLPHRANRLRGMASLVAGLPRLLARRRTIQRSRRVSDRGLFPYLAPRPRWLMPYWRLVGGRPLGAALGDVNSVPPAPRTAPPGR